MWIELHDSARDHPKIIKIARDLGLSQAVTLGHVTSLWLWTLRMAPDGDLSSFDVDDIEIGAQWEGERGAFVAAAVARRLLDETVDGIVVHDWDDYSGTLKAAIRKRNQRVRKRAEAGETAADTERQSQDGHVTSRDAERQSQDFTQNDRTTERPNDISERQPNAQSAALVATHSEPEPVITIPLTGSKEHPVTEADLIEWRAAFPGVDVMQALRSARQWSIANPQKRKTTRGVRRFLTAWLDREQNRGGRAPLSGARPFEDKTTQSIRAAYEATQVYNAQFEVNRAE